MNYYVVCRVLGLLLAPFSLSMLVGVPFAMYYGEWLMLGELAACSGMGLLISAVLYLIGRNTTENIFRRETLAVVGLSWICAAALGALPFYLSGAVPTVTDAFFEAMSGLTTTGSTVITDIDAVPRSIVIWRSFLHFLGGLGIVVLFVAVLPLVGVGARALFKTEAPGPVTEGLTPRIRDTSVVLLKIYVGFNIAEAILLMIAGMSFYDAVNHAMATMATGGFSTQNASIGAYNSPWIEWIIVIFMFLAGTNFTLHADAARGRLTYWKSAEFRVYVGILLSAAGLYTFMLWFHDVQSVSAPNALNIRDGIFTALTLQTTTGFGTVNFDEWPHGARMVSLMIMFVGGCAGSTAGGMKVIRWVIISRIAIHALQRNVSPRRVTTLKLDNRILDDDVSRGVLIFSILYLVIFALGALAISILSPDQSLLSSITAAIATLNNIGPGLEAVGASMNYAGQTQAAKWVMSLLMLMGRLELFPILVLFSFRFWKPS